MPRALTTNMKTAVETPVHGYVHLLEMQFADANNNPQTLDITDAAQDIVALGKTWTAVGGAMVLGSVEEGTDLAGAQVELSLSGVSTTPLNFLFNCRYRGRLVRLYRAHYEVDGTITADPLLIFEGLMNGDFKVAVHRSTESGPAGTVTISTTCGDVMAGFSQARGIQTNVQSHQSVFPGDTFFSFVPYTQQVRTVPWGGEGQVGYNWGKNPGVPTGGGSHQPNNNPGGLNPGGG